MRWHIMRAAPGKTAHFMAWKEKGLRSYYPLQGHGPNDLMTSHKALPLTVSTTFYFGEQAFNTWAFAGEIPDPNYGCFPVIANPKSKSDCLLGLMRVDF
jgi:hypothetical protein